MHDTMLATNYQISSIQIIDIDSFTVLYKIESPLIYPTTMQFIDNTDLFMVSGSYSILCFFHLSNDNHCLIKEKELKG
jgi:hypothetical protein